MPAHEQIAQMLSFLRRTARQDPRAALFLRAYYSKRAMLLDEPLRTSTLADLAVYASRASAEDIDTAKRYANLRAVLRDLHKRLATLPAASVGASTLDHVVATGRRTDLVKQLMLAAVGIGALSFVAGLMLHGAMGSLALVLGVLLLLAARLLSWLVRGMEHDALSAVDRANDATARAQLRVDSESAHRALVDGPDGAWLRELATAHPALAIPELEPIVARRYA